MASGSTPLAAAPLGLGRLPWAPLPLVRDGSGTSSNRVCAFRRRRPLRLKLPGAESSYALADSSDSADEAEPPSPAAVSSAGVIVGAAYAVVDQHRATSPTHLSQLFQRGFVSLLALLPRLWLQKTVPILTASVAAGVFTFLSFSLPSLVLFSLVGLVAWTIYRFAVTCRTVAVVLTGNEGEDDATCALTEDEEDVLSALPRASSAPALTPPAGQAPAGSPLSLLATRRSTWPRPSQRRRAAVLRVSTLQTVPEAAPAEHAPPPPCAPPPPALPPSPRRAVVVPELLSPDGMPVTDIQLALYISMVRGTGMGDHTTPPLSPSPACAAGAWAPPAAATGVLQLEDSSDGCSGCSSVPPDEGCDAEGGEVEDCGSAAVPDAADDDDDDDDDAGAVDGGNGEAGDGGAVEPGAEVGERTMFGWAREVGESWLPWVGVPMAVACVPVAMACTLPVVVPLVCTYGVVRLGVSAARFGAGAVLELIPSRPPPPR